MQLNEDRTELTVILLVGLEDSARDIELDVSATTLNLKSEQ